MREDMTPKVRIFRWRYSLFTIERKTNEKQQPYGDGYYRHKSGLCCRFYFEQRFDKIGSYTTLDVQWHGYTYMKTYKAIFSDHGIKKISAAFINEILQGKYS